MKIIADEEYLERTEAAQFIGISTSALDKLLVKHHKGKLNVALPLYQPNGKGAAMYFNKALLKQWITDVMNAGGFAVVAR